MKWAFEDLRGRVEALQSGHDIAAEEGAAGASLVASALDRVLEIVDEVEAEWTATKP